MKQKLIIITGPTAIGKSDIAIRLAKILNAEIISADSMQVYKKLNIGTGKILQDEMQGIAHHLIDIINPDEQYSVGSFVEDCKNKILDITKRGKKIIITGGTGLYINALLNGHNFANAPKSDSIREKYNRLARENGNDYIYKMLIDCDKISANKISQNDTKRIIRALEIYEITGKPKSDIANINTESEYDYRLFILNDIRENIYTRINSRVDKMFVNGLLQEVENLMQYQNCQSMQAIGYKEIVNCINNNLDIEDTKELIKQNSRRYAKRQLTYFKGLMANKIWIDLSKVASVMDEFECFLNDF